MTHRSSKLSLQYEVDGNLNKLRLNLGPNYSPFEKTLQNMHWTNFIFFMTLQREIPFGNARSVNFRETFTDIVKDLAEIKEFLRRNDENNEENNTLSEKTSEKNSDSITENANVDAYDHFEIEFEDIQWKRSKFRGTDFILSFLFLPPFNQ